MNFDYKKDGSQSGSIQPSVEGFQKESSKIFSELEKENKQLHEQIGSLQWYIKQYQTTIAEQEKEIKVLRAQIIQNHLSTPEKSQYYPNTSVPQIQGSLTPAVKTEEKSEKKYSYQPRSLLQDSIFASQPPIPLQPVLTSEALSLTNEPKMGSSTLKDNLFLTISPMAYEYNGEEKKEIYNEMIKFYEPDFINFFGQSGESKTDPFISKLDLEFWPILPKGYKWVYNGEGYQVCKHINVEKIKIETIVFGPENNFSDKVNYLTLFNGVTVQSYANTRPEKLTYDRPRGKKISYADSAYQGGHCIDHADTIEEKDLVLSTADQRNFIPEPALWNRFRNHYVRHKIRASAGSYMQVIYYHPYNPYVFQDHLFSRMLVKGRNKSYVYLPRGAYFSHVANRKIFNSFDVDWRYNFKSIVDISDIDNSQKNEDSQYVKAVKIFQLPNTSCVPTALFDNFYKGYQVTDNELINYQQNVVSFYKDQSALCGIRIPLNEGKPISSQQYEWNRLERSINERVYCAAEIEYCTLQYKMNFALKLAEDGDIHSAIVYLERVCKHIELLRQYDQSGQEKPLISQASFDFFKQVCGYRPELDAGNKYQEILSHVM